MQENKHHNKLANYLLTIFLLIISTFVLFHAYLSISLSHKYTKLAQQNKILSIDIPPQRGIILASNKQPLTKNEPSYILKINNQKGLNYIKKNFPNIYQKVLEQQKKLIAEQNQQDQHDQPTQSTSKTQTQLTTKNTNDQNQNTIQFPYIVNINEEQGTLLLAKSNSTNIEIQTSITRKYLYPTIFAHTIGYTSTVFKEDLEQNPDLHFNDIIGRAGLEKQYDSELRGTHGQKIVEIDALGHIITSDKTKTIPAQDGANILTYLDLKMQKNLYDSLKAVIEKYHIKGGAGVILDVNTGAVVSIVSYPSYDINKFSQGISYKDYNKLIKDKRNPLFNRAIMAQAPPGSTFKTMVAVAALQEKAITEYTQFYSSGVIKLAGGTPFQEYHQHVYGWLNVREALMVSSNIFFCKTVLKLGIDKLDKYLEHFNIGKPTGIDLPNEASGRIPSIEEKIKLAKNGAYWLDPIWYPEGDSCNSAIGQGITLVTPIQLALVASTIANKGTVYKPQIVKSIIYPDNTTKEFKPQIKDKVPASKHIFEVVQEGMHMSVYGSRGIIYNLRNSPVEVAAKTGTAEFGVKTKDGYLTTHAWIMGFYPYKQPHYAFAIFLESGGSSLHAAEVMEIFLNKTY